MKRLHLILGRGALLAIAAFAALAVSSTSTAQTVTVNGTNVVTCTPGQTNLQVDSNNNIIINCTVGGTTTFSCTATANPTSIQTGVASSTSLLSAICNGTIGTGGVMWTVPAGFAITSGTVNSQQIIVNAGTAAVSTTPYQFGVSVTPVTGSVYTNNAIPLTVTAASTGGSPGGTSGCASSNGTFVKNGIFYPSFAAVGGVQSASYMVPTTFMALNNYVLLTTVQNTGNWNSGLPIELALSPCPGDFTASVPPGCTTFSNAEAGQLYVAMSAVTAGKIGATCVLTPPPSNAPYYLNVRAVNKDLTPSCPYPGNVNNAAGNACGFVVELHWGPS